MKDLQIFSNNHFGQVRVTTNENNEPLFCLADVCKILGIANHRDVKSRLSNKGVVTADTLTQGGTQKLLFINESNFYKIVFQSRKAEAEAFTDWVTSEVLPTIRKHGAYLTQEKVEEALSNPDTLIRLATEIKEARQAKEVAEEKARLQMLELKKQAPKVEYYEEVLQSDTTYTTNQIAKELGMAAPTLNKRLKQMGVQYKQSGVWMLYQRYQNKGYQKTRTHPYTGSDGEIHTKTYFVWTEQGRLFVHGLFKAGAEANQMKL